MSHRALILLIAVTVVWPVGCNPSPGGSSSGGARAATANGCTIDGQPWAADPASYAGEIMVNNGKDKGLDIHLVKGAPKDGLWKASQEVHFAVPSDEKPGAIKLDGNSAQFHKDTDKPGGLTYNAADGKLAITKIDADHVEGTFAFQGKTWDDKPVNVTDGAFNLKRKK
jgi:hypothetical protein